MSRLSPAGPSLDRLNAPSCGWCAAGERPAGISDRLGWFTHQWIRRARHREEGSAAAGRLAVDRDRLFELVERATVGDGQLGCLRAVSCAGADERLDRALVCVITALNCDRDAERIIARDSDLLFEGRSGGGEREH